MALEKSKWWKTPPYSNIVGGLGVLAIAGILRLAYEWVTAPTALTSIKNHWDLTVSSFSFILNYEFKLWWLIGFSIWIVFFRFMLKVDKLNKESKPSFYVHPDSIPNEVLDKMSNDIEREREEKSDKESKMVKYKADKFLRIVWVWDWIYNNLIDVYEIKNIKACCPEPSCNNERMSRQSSSSIQVFICPKCRKKQIVSATEAYIEKLILKKSGD